MAQSLHDAPLWLSSPLESLAASTDSDSSDEDDFFAGLTRRLTTLHESRPFTTLPITATGKPQTQKTSAKSGSPKSILSGIGSWSGSGDGSPTGPSQVPSPPTTPFSADDAWDVIYAAAGQVARLKMNDEVTGMYEYDLHNRGILVPPPRNPPSSSLYSNQRLTQPSHMLKQQCASVWGRQAKANWLAQRQQQIHETGRNAAFQGVKCGRGGVSLPQSSWPTLQLHNQNRPGQVHPNGSGSGAKRGCTGTGVFLPRQYGNPPESRKKSSCPPVQLPAKAVHALKFNTNEPNVTGEVRFSEAFVTEYDALVGRKNGSMMQQRLSGRSEEVVPNHEIRLPQEWTY